MQWGHVGGKYKKMKCNFFQERNTSLQSLVNKKLRVALLTSAPYLSSSSAHAYLFLDIAVCNGDCTLCCLKVKTKIQYV